MNLTEAKAGQEVTISCLASAGQEGFRLRELGFGEGQRIRLIHKHDPLICQVGTCRIGVCRRLAVCIKVQQLNGDDR